MARTVVECLTPAVPCAECEERDCCRDERRVAQLRASVAELKGALREILALRTRDNPICHCGGCSQCVARAALAADREGELR